MPRAQVRMARTLATKNEVPQIQIMTPRRLIALFGFLSFALLAGIGLGSLAVQGNVLQAAGLVTLTVWGCWGINALLRTPYDP